NLLGKDKNIFLFNLLHFFIFCSKKAPPQYKCLFFQFFDKKNSLSHVQKAVFLGIKKDFQVIKNQ
ncbi:MAG: hypothetical protein RL757_2683, partial [Bacteroidota bacterium]